MNSFCKQDEKQPFDTEGLRVFTDHMSVGSYLCLQNHSFFILTTFTSVLSV
jgi:hypothetical protein